MKRILALFQLLLLFLFVQAQNPCPQVIPALQQWKGGKGTLQLPAQGNIVIHPSDKEALSTTASILTNDLKELFGWKYTVQIGKPKAKDIYLSLKKADEQLGEEGYVLTINHQVKLEAPTPKGVFWGTRTLLQMLYRQEMQLAKGVANDWPEFPSRGFMLDVGRKFFTLDYLKQQIKVLSFY